MNGKTYKAKSGKYLEIKRFWKDGDQVTLDFDMTAKVVEDPAGSGDAAIVRGPVVLSFDTRLIPRRDGVDVPPMYRFEFEKGKDGTIELEEVRGHSQSMWMVFNVPCLDEGGGRHLLPLCDYASAGNTWQEGNLFRVWTPQPFDFRHLYVNNLDWHANCTVGVPRPDIPELYKVR